MGARGRFPPEARLRSKRDYARIQRQGFRVHTDAFTIIVDANQDGSHARFGCAVSRKIGNAVVRNRVRRLLKEIFRRCASELPAIDLVFVAKPEAAALAERGLDPMSETLLPAIDRAISGLAKKKKAGKEPRGRGSDS
jgi:ribonuclease P protein component